MTKLAVRLRCLTSLCLFLGIMGIYAQESSYIYTQYTAADGLPSNECYAIIQDSRGYVWVSTDNGVVRFDGSEFKVYGIDDGLQDLVIFKMLEDENGKIWMGGLNRKLSIYHPEIDRFKPYEHQKILTNNYYSSYPLKHFHASDDTLWVAAQQLIKIAPNGKVSIRDSITDSSFKIYEFPDFALTTMSIVGIKEVSRNQFPFLELISLKNEKKILFKKFQDYKVLTSVHNISRIHDGLIYAFGPNYGVLNNSNEIIYEGFEEDIIYLSKSKEGSPVMGLSGGKGIRIYQDIYEQAYETIISDVEATYHLEDKEGGYWITTLDKGLFYIKNPNIKYVSKAHQNNYYTHIDLDNLGHLYVVDFVGSLFEIVPNQPDQVNRLYQNKGKESKMVQVEGDELWLNSGSTTYAFDSQNKSFTKIINPTYWNPEHCILTDIIDLDSVFLGLSLWESIFHIDKKSKKVTVCSKRTLGLPTLPRSYAMVLDGNQVLIGTDEGLYIYDLKQNIIFKNDSIPTVRIEKIVKDQHGTYYMATKGMGLLVWKRGTVPYSIREEDGLLADVLEDVTLDEEGEIWIASARGIDHVRFNDKEQYKIQNYTQAHGLPVPDIYHTVWSKGKLYAATGKGVIALEVHKADEIGSPPVLTSITVNQKNVLLTGEQFFKHNNNDIRLSYETIDFRQGRDVLYRYTINNSDTLTTRERYINLNNLTPNDYTIKLAARNRDGLYSEPAIVKFTIQEPWWKSWWFFTALSLGIIGLISFYIRWRINVAKGKLEIVEEIYQLEKAALQAQMNPHFIFNSLNSIQRFIMNKDKEKAMEYLTSFAGLIRKYLQSSTQNQITLSDEIDMLSNYLALESLRFDNTFEYSITIDDKIDPLSTHIPPMLIQPFVENAILHGMKGKVNKEGQIDIDFKIKDKYIIATVTDNGPGIDTSIPTSSKHKSMGTSITKRRIAHILEKQGTGYELDIESSSKGTTVRIEIPM